MISAIAKRRLALRDGDKFVTVVPGEFVSLNDSVKADPMFAWAVKDGALIVSEQVIVPVATDINVGSKAEPAKKEKQEETPAPAETKPKKAAKKK